MATPAVELREMNDEALGTAKTVASETSSSFLPTNHEQEIGEKSPNHENEPTTGDATEESTEKPKRGVALWSIIVALCVTSVLSSLEGTIVSTALPTIVSRLGGQEVYILAVNPYFLTRQVNKLDFQAENYLT